MSATSSLCSRLDDCVYFVKSLVVSQAAVDAERARRRYFRETLPWLEAGSVFALVDAGDSAFVPTEASDVESSGGAAASRSSNAENTAEPLLTTVTSSPAYATASRLLSSARDSVRERAAQVSHAASTFTATAKESMGASSSVMVLTRGPGKSGVAGEPVLVRLARPRVVSSGPPSALRALMDRVSTLTGDGSELMDAEMQPFEAGRNDTCIAWSSLALERNRPKSQGRIPLHRVQVVKERQGGVVLLDHEGVVLFEAKVTASEQASLEAGVWVRAIEHTRTHLAVQIEEEASAIRGTTTQYRREELLKARQAEREKRKAALGLAGMTYTAKVMAERG